MPAARAVRYFGRCRALLPAMDDVSAGRRYVRPVPKARRVPISRDVILAAAVTAYGLVVTFARIGDGTIYHGPRLPNAVLSVLVTGTLAWRRTRPLPALAWIFAVWVMTFVVARHDLQLVAGFFVIIVLAASAAYHASRRVALACLGIALATLAVLIPLEPQLGGASAAVYDGAFVVLPWLAARGLRSREDRAAALGSQLALAQASHEARQREILRQERAQIARELHDIVAHSVSVILLQIGAARMRAPGQPDITQPLHAAEASGRQALAELRRLLGVLNDCPAEDGDRDEGTAERMPDAPQPSIAGLGRLAAAVRAAGLDVDLAIVGEVRPLPPGLELSVYRIAQEALTNVLKHAQASMARVRVDYGPDAVTIEITDDGTARTASGAPAGHGLVGMRQRAQVFGGTTIAGPAPGGGWQVRAELPAEPATGEATA
jgi:signal transduction histidine kinase